MEIRSTSAYQRVNAKIGRWTPDIVSPLNLRYLERNHNSKKRRVIQDTIKKCIKQKSDDVELGLDGEHKKKSILRNLD